MVRRFVVLVMLGVALSAPAASAYGTLEPTNSLAPTLQPILQSELRFFVYSGVYVFMPSDAPRYRFSFAEDGMTWTVYEDVPHAGRRNSFQDADEPAIVAMSFPAVHGNLTDHALVVLPNGFTFRVCTDRVDEGLADGAALGLRCGGDIDQDGEGDFSEAIAGRNPLGGG